MKRLLSGLLLCMYLSRLWAQETLGGADPRLTGIDSVVLRVLDEWKAPGCAVAVVEKGRVLFAGGWGYRDYAKRLPVTEQTLFQIGSCTKAFTCALIGVLADEGVLDLDGKVWRYVPSFRLFNDPLTQQATLRDFMCHRSGLPRHDLSWLQSPTTRDSLVQRMAYFEPSAELRERYQYNNFGFTLLGVVAERVTGKTWEALIRERLLQPLGMRSARFDLWTLPSGADVARGHRVHADTIRPMDYLRIEGMGPAGSLCANAAEMAQWMLLWLNGGQMGDRRILSPSYVREALSAQAPISSSLPSAEQPNIFSFGYGFGWILSSYYGHYRAEHGGNINGFSASVCLFPTDSIGIAVLVNQNRSQVPAVVRNYIADRLLGLTYRDWNAVVRTEYVRNRLSALSAQQAQVQTRKKDTAPTHPLPQYAGSYCNGGYGCIEVFARNDSLFAFTPGVAYHLEHHHYDVFRAVPLSEEQREDLLGLALRFQFFPDLQGELSELWAHGMEPAVAKVAFRRQTKLYEVSTETLQRYCGTYRLGASEVRVFLKGNTLMIYLAGQPEYETVPTGEHTFRLKALEGYSVRFEMNEDNSAQAVVFLQPNGTFRAVRKP